MAIAFVNLGNSVGLGSNNEDPPDFNTTTNATSYEIPSWTPPTTGLIVLFVHGAGVGSDVPAVSGNGLTWVQIQALGFGTSGRNMALFAADAAGATAGVTTVNYGASTQSHFIASLFQVTGVDLSGGVAAAFVQKPTNSGSATTGASITLAAAGNSANRPIACFVTQNNVNELAPRANWTELDDMQGSGLNREVQTQYRGDAFETTASATWTTSSDWGGIAAEIKALVTGGGSLPPFRHKNQVWQR